MLSSLPSPRDTEAKLDHILLHAARIFAEHGFEGTSIRDISRSTGVSLAGLYYYFDSKQKLLFLIQNNTFRYIVNRLEVRLDGLSDPLLRLHVLIHNHVEYFLSHPNEMKVLSHEEGALEEPYHKEVAAIKRRYYSIARQIVEDLVSTGLAPELNHRVAVLGLFGMMNWIYQWHNPEVDPAAEELAAAIQRIFLHGILPPGYAADDGVSRQSTAFSP